MTKMTASRTHEIHCGHRVHGHGGKCQHLHGHSYIFHFHCEADNNELNELGMVLDFGDIKSKLCAWLDDHYDHHFLIWEKDPMHSFLREIDPTTVVVPFNPTAENIAQYMVEVVAPVQFAGTGITLTGCTVNETSKCSASFQL